jgi:hypothetical protein
MKLKRSHQQQEQQQEEQQLDNEFLFASSSTKTISSYIDTNDLDEEEKSLYYITCYDELTLLKEIKYD